jgi:hypothetical protein
MVNSGKASPRRRRRGESGARWEESRRRGLVSFEAPVLIWLASQDRNYFRIEDCWSELARTVTVSRRGVSLHMQDVNDLIDAILQLHEMEIVEYDWTTRVVSVNRAVLDSILALEAYSSDLGRSANR